MKKSKFSPSNIIFVIVIALLIIPQTRKPIQVFMHKGMALINPSEIKEDKREQVASYNWNLVDPEGNTYNFKEAQGKVVFINFWATWCPPCIAEMPNIDDLFTDYKDRVVFLLVSNENLKTIKDFKDKNDYNFKFYQSLSNPPRNFNTTSIPQTYIIDKSGAIVMDKTGAANWNSDSVRSLLEKLLKA
ncbi:thiol-disulfide isomerase/thioredoxin [Oceanihabitans sediminis]|uniref:TlpA family protein disulfide reductase n=1 Tax=Oceanihabitans sediminis TaxID=1812012 RepID=A0A368P2T0_9FLAO|nr:TlpA disulfide reductase family protein [Oceanihabitans sediminis]RBP30765.1 thiol-disulfide isomerase/thioredoxin [Oceanihabitans sediminis]RCU56736.1 TlpA family protein disulfide reductase [Oceanihabitans sediminis]